MDKKEEAVTMKGHISIVHKRDGEVIDTREIDNLICNEGKTEMAKLLVNTGSPTAFGWIAIGIGTTAANATDSTLGTESMRESAVASNVTVTTANDTAQLDATFNIVATLAITESGCLNAASSGDLLNRQVFSALNVVSGDTIEYTWKITMS